MKTSRVVQILGILISLAGLAYMGYNHGKGINDNYGLWIVLSGTVLTIIGSLLDKKEKGNKEEV